MGLVPLDNFSLNSFWERTPTPLKYILIVLIFVVTFYFFFSRRIDVHHLKELEMMKTGIAATYELIDNFEEFREEQDFYNREVINYLRNLHTLVEELNESTNRKLNMILSSGDQNADDIIEKIQLLNESFQKLSEAYNSDIKEPNLDDNRVSEDAKLEIGVRKQK